jgi:hypothetical protein
MREFFYINWLPGTVSILIERLSTEIFLFLNISRSAVFVDPDPYLCFWASRIRIRLSQIRILLQILPSPRKNSKKTLISTRFATSL